MSSSPSSARTAGPRGPEAYQDETDDEDLLSAVMEFERRPDQKTRTDEVRILYATDGYPVVCSLHLLLGDSLLPEIYVVGFSYVTGPSDENRDDGSRPAGAPLVATFYLLARTGTEQSRQRVRPMFVCKFEGARATARMKDILRTGDPLPTDFVIANMDQEATFAIHNDIILALSVISHPECGAHQRAKRSAAAAAEGDTRESRLNKLLAGDNTSIRAIAASVALGRAGLAVLMLRHEARVVATFRRMYNGSFTTPFWFVSKFGPSEATLVAGLRYYLLEARPGDGVAGTFDLQAIKDLCVTFTTSDTPNPSGLSPPQLTTFAKFSRYWCTSVYASAEMAGAIRAHIKARVESDMAYMTALGSLIDRYRRALRIPAREFIHYVYLAHFEGFNRSAITEHLTEAIKNNGGPTSAPERASGEFFRSLKELCDLPEYVKRNVTVKSKKLTRAAAVKYAALRTYGGAMNGPNVVGVCDTAFNMAKRADKLVDDLKASGLAFAGRLAWATNRGDAHDMDAPEDPDAFRWGEADSQQRGTKRSAAGPGGTFAIPDAEAAQSVGPLAKLLSIVCSDQRLPDGRSLLSAFCGRAGHTPPCPVYRIALHGGKQAFAVVAADAWSERVAGDLYPAIDKLTVERSVYESMDSSEGRDGAALIDLAWTTALYRSIPGNAVTLAAHNPELQMYHNRNEVFNDRLAVSNMVLDIDLSLRASKDSPLLLDVHRAMRCARTALVKLLARLFTEAAVDPSDYPIYFYKTSCPSGARTRDGLEADDVEWGEDCTMDCDWPDDGAGDQSLECYDDVWLDALEPEQLDDARRVGGAAPLDRVALSDGTTVDELRNLKCRCTKKLGFRVVVPIPSPYALTGREAVLALARLAQHAMLMENGFVCALDPYLADYEFIDTGVYSPGRSLRLPLFGKVCDNGTVQGRLLPFLVFPERCESRRDFFYAHLDPANFHYHALRADNPCPDVIITEISGVHNDFFSNKEATNRAKFFPAKMRLRDALRALQHLDGLASLERDDGDSALSDADAAAVVEHIAMPVVRKYMEDHFPSHVHEYRHVSLSDPYLTHDRIRFSLKPMGCSRQRFTCLKHRHRGGASQTVLAAIAVFVNAQGVPCASLQTKCFATKCGGNQIQTQFTVPLCSKWDRE